MEEIVALAKRRGFIYPTSEIYGGLANSYDYGPLGAQLLKNLRDVWWQEFIIKRSDMVPLDTQILLNPNTWVASGHVATFTDPLVEDTITKKRYRADHLIEAWLAKHGKGQNVQIENMTIEEMGEFIKINAIKSPDGNVLTEPRQFNLLFESAIGTVAGEKSKVYLRGETAQGIFTNFHQVLKTMRVKLPFGIGNIGKSFRNEITTGQFIFRTLEFEQAEIEYFFDPQKTDWQTLMQEWKDAMWSFLTETVGLRKEKLRWREHTDKERSHYSKATFDLEYHYPFGWKELWGIAYRTDFDLKEHMKLSQKDLRYTDPHTGEKIVPHVIEPALGINRLLLALLCDSYRKDEERSRTYLQIKTVLAPVQVAVIPLARNDEALTGKAYEIFMSLKKQGVRAAYDDRGNIGKAYLYQDEIGTPFAITVDFTTLEDGTVTIRNAVTTAQERVHAQDLYEILLKKM